MQYLLDRRVRQYSAQRCQVEPRQWVDEVRAPVRGDLDEAHLLGVVVTAVSLGVDADAVGELDRARRAVELRLLADQRRPVIRMLHVSSLLRLVQVSLFSQSAKSSRSVSCRVNGPRPGGRPRA